MSHFYYFPEPYPDELIGSVLARACRQLGIPYKQLARQVIGHSRRYLPLVMSADLTHIAYTTGLDAEALLWDHTVFPYVTSFMSQEETDRLATSLLASNAVDNATLSQLGSQGGLGHRFCPICFEDDLQTYGEAYWHRMHNLPLVQICQKHQVWLMQERLPTDRSVVPRSKMLLLPDMQVASQVTSLIPQALASVISTNSQTCLDTKERRESDEWNAEYRATAFAKGLTKEGICMASRLLAKSFENTFGLGFLEQSRLELGWGHAPWFALMFHESPGIQFVTPKHILMQVFLETVKSDSPLVLADSPFYSPSGRSSRDYRKLDEEYVHEVKKALNKLKKQGGRISVTQMLSDLGIWGTYRKESHRLPKTKALIAEFRKTGYSERKVGGRNPRRPTK